MTNRTPYIAPEHQDDYNKSSFKNEGAKAEKPVAAVKPAPARKAAPAKKKASK